MPLYLYRRKYFSIKMLTEELTTAISMNLEDTESFFNKHI